MGDGAPFPFRPAAYALASLYRFLKDRGLTERELLNPAAARSKFEAEYANQIWQSHMLYGSAP